MIPLENIRKLLKDRTISSVAEATGLHPNCIYMLKKEDSNPKYATLKAVSDYLEAQLEHYQK